MRYRQPEPEPEPSEPPAVAPALTVEDLIGPPETAELPPVGWNASTAHGQNLAADVLLRAQITAFVRQGQLLTGEAKAARIAPPRFRNPEHFARVYVERCILAGRI